MSETAIQIPDKLYFKIGDVAKILSIKPYVLRFWETEFPEIVPSKSHNKQRLYKRHDVETIVRIHDLLYRQKFTIAGARKKLKELKRHTREDQSQRQTDFIPTVEVPESVKALRLAAAEVIEDMTAYLND
jgi:DNA-binding transcriptional MerR regulator